MTYAFCYNYALHHDPKPTATRRLTFNNGTKMLCCDQCAMGYRVSGVVVGDYDRTDWSQIAIEVLENERANLRALRRFCAPTTLYQIWPYAAERLFQIESELTRRHETERWRLYQWNRSDRS